jgi:hypothetical protein
MWKERIVTHLYSREKTYMYQRVIAKIVLNGEVLNAFPPILGKRQKLLSSQ